MDYFFGGQTPANSAEPLPTFVMPMTAEGVRVNRAFPSIKVDQE